MQILFPLFPFLISRLWMLWSCTADPWLKYHSSPPPFLINRLESKRGGKGKGGHWKWNGRKEPHSWFPRLLSQEKNKTCSNCNSRIKGIWLVRVFSKECKNFQTSCNYASWQPTTFRKGLFPVFQKVFCANVGVFLATAYAQKWAERKKEYEKRIGLKWPLKKWGKEEWGT